MDPSKYDPNAILQAAENKRAQNDIQGAHMMFESALLGWVDDAREGAGDPDQMREAIATLWLAYADFHKSNKMWKSAMETYEKAVMDPVAGSLGRIWLEYARFAEDRGKLVTAQNVYLRALVGDGSSPPAVIDEQDTTLLWEEFLDMMRKKNSSLTLSSLKQAVEKEHLRKRALAEPVASAVAAAPPQMLQPNSKRPRLDEPSPMSLTPATPMEVSKTYVVTPEDVESEKSLLLEVTSQMPDDISAAWMIRDGDSPATPPEYPLFTPSRPKLSDSTGRDLVGDDMALAIAERLMDDSGTILLETCRGLWLLTALKEKESASAIERLDKTMKAEFKLLESNLEARLSVAGAARAAVELMNTNERKAFESSCSQRRSQLLSEIAWGYRQLLCVQQAVLTKLQVPGFEGPTVDSSALEFQSRICSLLHTAFFLRKNLGEKTHKATLKASVTKLKRDASSRSPVPRGRTPPRSPVRTPPRSPVPVGMGMPPQMAPPPIYGFQQQQPLLQQQPQVYTMQGVYPPMQQQQQIPPPPPPPPPPHMQQNPNMPVMAPANNYGYQPPQYY